MASVRSSSIFVMRGVTTRHITRKMMTKASADQTTSYNGGISGLCVSSAAMMSALCIEEP